MLQTFLCTNPKITRVCIVCNSLLTADALRSVCRTIIVSDPVVPDPITYDDSTDPITNGDADIPIDTELHNQDKISQ